VVSTLQPSNAEDHFNLGRELIVAGEMVPAIRSLSLAIQLRPDYFAAYRQLGVLQHTLGDLEAAKAWYRIASGCAPTDSQINMELGILCGELGEHEEAAEYFLRSLDSERLGATEYLKIGAGWVKAGQISRGMDCLKQSIELKPTTWAWTELGYCQFRLRALDSAEASYREALRCDPEYAAAHANLGLLLLLLGDYAGGFREFEWRLRLKNSYRIEGFRAPRWTGEPLEGGAILPMQSKGMEIHCSSCAMCLWSQHAGDG
jgi:tetratricopeptide (TPR) repeat protein